LRKLIVGEPSVPLSLFRVAGEAGQKGLFGVHTCERKIGLAALVPNVEPDKTEIPGICGSPVLRQARKKAQPNFSRGLNPTGV
jgi:hypothetical protein